MHSLNKKSSLNKTFLSTFITSPTYIVFHYPFAKKKESHFQLAQHLLPRANEKYSLINHKLREVNDYNINFNGQQANVWLLSVKNPQGNIEIFKIREDNTLWSFGIDRDEWIFGLFYQNPISLPSGIISSIRIITEGYAQGSISLPPLPPFFLKTGSLINRTRNNY